MKVKITYTLNSNPSEPLVDTLNWPDLATLEEVQPYVGPYLDAKYSTGTYTLVSVTEAV